MIAELLKLFLTFFRIGLFTIGGGYAMIPLIEKYVVERNRWLSKEEFVDYYPFVPYQFKLIMQVFNSFLNLGYVAKEVKGNERSIIKVIHSTAKTNAESEVGKFISFDELYNNMFEEGLQARGQKAVNNALEIAKTYDRDPKLARRVANILFMICNISQTDQLLFPASVDNVTSLLDFGLGLLPEARKSIQTHAKLL